MHDSNKLKFNRKLILDLLFLIWKNKKSMEITSIFQSFQLFILSILIKYESSTLLSISE